MKAFKPIPNLCLCFISMLLFSCDSSERNGDTPQSVQLLSIEATSNIDFTARRNWTLSVYNYPYLFEPYDGKFVAVPANYNNPFAFEVSENDKSGRAIMTLLSPDYFKTRNTSPFPANIQDQSTPEKLLSCDVLRGDYYGQAQENITVNLFHENALLMFNTENLPADAQVYIYEGFNKQTITPLQDADDPASYRALVFPDNYLFTLYAIVRTNGKEYRQVLRPRIPTRMNITYPEGIGHSAVITFTVSMDEENNLRITNLEEKEFVRNWPVTL